MALDCCVLLCRLLLATERCTSLTTDRWHVWTDGLNLVTHCDDSCHVIEVISSFVALEILLWSMCEKLHSELHLPSHWNPMQRAACRGLSVLWCKNLGQPLVFSGNFTWLKKSPYLLPVGTFHSLSMLAWRWIPLFVRAFLMERRHSSFFRHFGYRFGYCSGSRGHHGGGRHGGSFYWADQR
jgi:hypothetical protein